MILLPPLNLFFYNIVLGFLDCQYKRSMDESPHPEISFWHKVPIIKAFLQHPEYPEPIFPNPTEIIPELNPYVNALILLPAIFKHKYLKVLDVLVILWNLVICKRILIYYVNLMITLWEVDFSVTHFLAILIIGISISMAHILLMYYTAKLSLRQALNWRRQ